MPAMGDDPRPGPLSGRRFVTTREHAGDLESRLVVLGADVVHVPAIETVDIVVDDPPGPPDMLVVTSPNGARRAAPWIGPATRLAAVGEATARLLSGLAGRPMAVVPDDQTAAGLAAVLPSAPRDGGRRLVVLRGDLAGPTVSAAARRLGWDTEEVTVYGTRLRRPDADGIAAAAGADAVLFASGSAARAWSGVSGVVGRRAVVIGPPSATAAREVGFDVVAIASVHSVPGLVTAVVDAFGAR
jgi:uroporphyrinogen-III synthase